MKRTDQATIIFRLPPEIKKQLQIKVLEEGTSIQELLENFTNNYLEEGNKMLKKDDFNAVTESFEKEIKETIFLEAIKKGNREQSDFDIGFDLLFEFMEKHPESNTTKNFIQYHAELEEINRTTHTLPDGTPCFTYLIGTDFLPHDWVDEDDMIAFEKFVHEADIEPQYKDEIVQEIEAN